VELVAWGVLNGDRHGGQSGLLRRRCGEEWSPELRMSLAHKSSIFIT
jgi:hypothetical protein